MSAKSIETDRLFLIPASYEMVVSLINNDKSFFEKFGFQAGNEWPRKDTYKILNIMEKVMPRTVEPSGYELWIIVNKESMKVIGDAGFKGQPNDDGMIEIGYGIIESEWSRGYGTEAVKELLKWGLSQKVVECITASCLITNMGSIRVLEKAGFKNIKKDEKMICWEIKKAY